MIAILTKLFLQYGAPLFAGVIVGFIFKLYFRKQSRSRIKEYQSEIARSHSRILKLEAINETLEKRLRDNDGGNKLKLVHSAS
jgi:hypothetical protein